MTALPTIHIFRCGESDFRVFKFYSFPLMRENRERYIFTTDKVNDFLVKKRWAFWWSRMETLSNAAPPLSSAEAAKDYAALLMEQEGLTEFDIQLYPCVPPWRANNEAWCYDNTWMQSFNFSFPT